MSAQAATVSSRTPWILNQHVADCVVFRSVTKVCRRISLRSASSFRRRRRRTFAASFDTSRLTAFSAQPAWVQGGHRWHKSLSAATFNAFGPRSLAAMEMQRHACAEARKQRASRPPRQELAVCKTLGSGCCTRACLRAGSSYTAAYTLSKTIWETRKLREALDPVRLPHDFD